MPDVTRFAIIVLLLSVAAVACGKKPAPLPVADLKGSLLQYVPADTPYLIANPVPLPDDQLDQLEPRMDVFLKAYSRIGRAALDEQIEQRRAEDADSDDIARIEALGNEVLALMTLDGIRAAGIGRKSTAVVYGDGLLPVLRIRLTDGKLMEKTIARIEDKASEKMSRSEIGGHSYRYLAEEDAKIVLAVIANDLVVSFVPATHSDELLMSVLGLSPPDKSMADSGEPQAIMGKYGFEPYYLMLVDITRIVTAFIDAPTGTNKELLSMLDNEAASLSDVCKTEIRELANVAPRMAAGFTEFSTERWSSSLMLELREDIADGLTTLVAPVPGLGLTGADLFSFGMSFDVRAARAFYAARLDAMEADPFECEHFEDMQNSVAAGREALNKSVPPIAYSLKGFLAVVDSVEGMDIQDKQPPTSVDARVLLSLDNPQGLVSMGAMFSPELAELDLQPDGKPVKLKLPPVSPALNEAYAAMTDNALAVSLGNDSVVKLGKLLEGGFAKPAPFISASMDTGRYYELIGQAMQLDPELEGESPELALALTDLMNTMADWYGTTTMGVNFTEQGIEMYSTIEIAADK